MAILCGFFQTDHFKVVVFSGWCAFVPALEALSFFASAWIRKEARWRRKSVWFGNLLGWSSEETYSLHLWWSAGWSSSVAGMITCTVFPLKPKVWPRNDPAKLFIDTAILWWFSTEALSGVCNFTGCIDIRRRCGIIVPMIMSEFSCNKNLTPIVFVRYNWCHHIQTYFWAYVRGQCFLPD